MRDRFRKVMRRYVSRPASLIALCMVPCSCATVPEFKPSLPLGEARSLPESLVLCDEYRMPHPRTRIVALRPLVDCVNQAASRYPSWTTDDPFLVFQGELNLKYGLFREEQWTPELAAEYETAVHAILRALWRGNLFHGVYTASEQEWVLRYFPDTAHALDAGGWEVTTQAAYDRRLEFLRAGVVSLLRGRDEFAALDSDTALRDLRLCGAYRELRTKVDLAGELWKDELELARRAPDSPELYRTRQRFEAELARAGDGLRELRRASFNARVCAEF